MKDYENKIKARILYLSVVTLIGAGICGFDGFFASDTLKNSDIYSFLLGLTCAITIIGALIIIKYKKIITSPEKLKLEYNKENDERKKLILSKAGIPFIIYTSVAMIIIGIIAGHYNILIFKTLIICALSQLIISVIVKLIYSKII